MSFLLDKKVGDPLRPWLAIYYSLMDLMNAIFHFVHMLPFLQLSKYALSLA